jgi:hypothetical protein
MLILVGIAVSLSLTGSRTYACDESMVYDNYSYSMGAKFWFLRIVGGKITLYEDKVTYRFTIGSTPETLPVCGDVMYTNSRPMYEGDNIEVRCKTDNGTITFKWELDADLLPGNDDGLMKWTSRNKTLIKKVRNALYDDDYLRCSIATNSWYERVRIVDKR